MWFIIRCRLGCFVLSLLIFTGPTTSRGIMPGIVKESYHGKTFEGNECDKIWKNIHLLKKMLVQYEVIRRIIEALEAVKIFNYTCCSKEVREGWKDALSEVSKTWSFFHEKYDINIPNKVHIIMDYVGDYIELTGKLLGHISDQIVECAHSHRLL